jgi:hypothetical protein
MLEGGGKSSGLPGSLFLAQVLHPAFRPRSLHQQECAPLGLCLL